ncbi:MAG: cadmium-translocating P-type ATPase [Acidobacteria bacterium]|nr:cadmium-translocating P-type ATPase [Acidobacteriota bacterium]
MQGSATAPAKHVSTPAPKRSLATFAESQDTIIATITAIAIAAYLVLKASHSGAAVIALHGALIFGGVPILVRLAGNAIRREFGSDLLAGFSIVTAAILGEYLVADIIVLMLAGGTALERFATRRASAVLGALAKRMPTTGHRVSDGGLVDINAEDICPGDILALLPHEICPVDGEVLEGHGEMDESYLTGEPYQISKAPGTNVLSGAVNGQVALKVRATRLAQDSRFARIMRVVEEAERHRPPMRRLADRLGAWYTPLALTIALVGWWAGGSPERFLAVIVIATPCPLLIAIPVAIIAGISLAAKRGIVIKNPAVLEQLDDCRTFIFDKTGTLTYGRPALTEIIAVPGFSEDMVLRAATSLEQYSRHPLAQAVLDAARSRSLSLGEVADVSEQPGAGLLGRVEGMQVRITGRNNALAGDVSLQHQLPAASSGLECLVFIDAHFAALFRFHDQPRAESRQFVRHLGRRHHASRVVLLSGDRKAEVEHLAGLVGIQDVHFGKSPEDKVAFVREANQAGKTLFVGDGINDAPAMLMATVGIAIGQNSDVTAESAHAVVLDSSLRKVDELIHIARRIRSVAMQSAVGGMLLSGAGMIFAAAGLLPPLMGAIAQEVIDLAAVLNALRATLGPKSLSDF